MNEWPLPNELPDPSTTPAIEASSVPDPYPFWGYKDLAFILLLFGVAAIGVGIVAFFLTRVFPGVLLLLLMQGAIYAIGLISLYCVMVLRYRKPFWEAMRWAATPRAVRNGALAGAGTAVASSLLAAAIGAQDLDQLPMKDLLSSRTAVAVIGVLAVTIGPLWEELTFRGFLLPLLSKSLGAPMGILITATAFALMHGQQYGWAWQALLPVGFAGVCFGIARIASDSTGVAAVMHAIYNLTVFSAFIAQGGAENIPW